MQIGQFITRKDVEEKIRQLALYDPLTGLPNRNLFNTLFGTGIARAQRRKSKVGLLLVDLDGFKAINDTHGHDAGDHLLKLFAMRLAGCIRDTDVVGLNDKDPCAARLGGDEFVVMLEDVGTESDLAQIAQRIIAVSHEPFDLAGPKECVSASIGMAVYPDDGSDIPTLLKCADAAMYRAKQAGKNQLAT
jgi:diguanylate cyclase (GGDEF)-like protein